MNTNHNSYLSITPAQYAPCQMSASEARELLKESEQRYANRDYVSESQMDAFFEE